MSSRFASLQLQIWLLKFLCYIDSVELQMEVLTFTIAFYSIGFDYHKSNASQLYNMYHIIY